MTEFWFHYFGGTLYKLVYFRQLTRRGTIQATHSTVACVLPGQFRNLAKWPSIFNQMTNVAINKHNLSPFRMHMCVQEVAFYLITKNLHGRAWMLQEGLNLIPHAYSTEMSLFNVSVNVWSQYTTNTQNKCFVSDKVYYFFTLHWCRISIKLVQITGDCLFPRILGQHHVCWFSCTLGRQDHLELNMDDRVAASKRKNIR